MRGVELTRAALTQAGVDSTKTPIYMTGGSSRIPFVQDRLGEVGTVMTLDDPKTVVSRGALAATLRGFTGGVNGAQGAGSRPGAAGLAGAAGAGLGAGAASAASRSGQSSQPGQSGPATPPGMPRAGQGQNQGPSQGPNQGSQSYNTSPQTAAFVPSSANAYGASNFASAHATSSSKPKKSNTPVIITACVAILAVVIAIGFVALNGGDDNGGGGSGGGGSNSDGGNPPFTEANPYTPAREPYESDMYKPLASLLPEVKDYTPTNFYNRIDSCSTRQDKASFAGAAYDGMDTKMYSCIPSRDSLEDHKDEFLYNNFRYTQTGDDAQKVYDHGKNSAVKGQVLQEAGNGWPEITFYPSANYSSPNVTVWYPEEKLVVLSNGKSDDTKESFIEMLKFYNLMPQD